MLSFRSLGVPRFTRLSAPSSFRGYAKVGQPAPDFVAKAVHNGSIIDVSLKKDYLGKYLVLVFYPLDFTFVCPTEITAFSDRAHEFHQLGANVAAVSVDSEFSHLKWAKTPRTDSGLAPLCIPLISDLNKEMAKAYGVLLEPKGVALRATFLLDKEGVVKHSTVNDLGIGRSVDETLRVLQALQHVEQHGEVCPVDWKRGQPAMKPTEKGVGGYFKSHDKK